MSLTHDIQLTYTTVAIVKVGSAWL